MLQRLDYAILLQSSELAIYLLAKTSTYKKKVFIKYQSELFVGIFGVFLIRIQSKCGKIRTGKTPNTDTFHALEEYLKLQLRGEIHIHSHAERQYDIKGVECLSTKMLH